MFCTRGPLTSFTVQMARSTVCAQSHRVVRCAAATHITHTPNPVGPTPALRCCNAADGPDGTSLTVDMTMATPEPHRGPLGHSVNTHDIMRCSRRLRPVVPPTPGCVRLRPLVVGHVLFRKELKLLQFPFLYRLPDHCIGPELGMLHDLPRLWRCALPLQPPGDG
mmetsp:Transcript_3948/g.6292  ORF Transcript_3948/g.6292 Transcript_3948/m.6292 type:complete len:165 (-) Transcript_3948:2866-3360(-)